MKKILNKYFFILILLLFQSCNKSNTIDIDVEGEVLKEMNAHKIPSVVTAVIKDGKIVWEGTFGDADILDSKPATSQSLYTIMSISKLFLATTVMQLWERELIDLEADINQYLPFEVRNPNFPNNKITPYMLLTHTSGLAWPTEEDHIPDFHHFYSNEEPPLISEWLPEYILQGGSQYRSSVWKEFAPGENYLYSNIATSVLALIVEQISGMDYRDFCQENILKPLDMHQSAFRLDRLNEELMVTPYDDRNNPMNYYTSRHYPVGFLSCNIEDFSHFVISFLNYGEYKGKRILNRSTVEKMMEIQIPNSGVSFLWWHYLGNSIGHLGGGTGFSTWAEWDFEDGSGVFIFSNKVNKSIGPKGRINELVRYQSNKF